MKRAMRMKPQMALLVFMNAFSVRTLDHKSPFRGRIVVVVDSELDDIDNAVCCQPAERSRRLAIVLPNCKKDRIDRISEV